MVHAKFLNDFKALQQKGRRIPIHIQEKVKQEIKSLIDQGHIVNLIALATSSSLVQL